MKRSICDTPALFLFCTACLTLFFLHIPLKAQEVQTPFDAEGKILVITVEMEKDLRIFVEYDNFVEARLYKLSDSSFVLEITQTTQGKIIRTRKSLTLSEVETFRNRLSAILTITPQLNPEERLSSWERTSLSLSSGFLGLIYGSLADAFSTPYYGYSRTGSKIAGWTLITPLVYAGTSLYSVEQPWFGRSASIMFSHGITFGFVHGALLYGLLVPEKDLNAEAFWATGITTGILQSVITMRLPESWGFNLGQTNVLTSLSASGTLAGFILPGMLGALEGNGWSSTAFCGTALGLSAVGYLAGYKIAQSQFFAGGDGTVFALPASFGLFLPYSMMISFSRDIENGKLLAGLTLGTHLLGYIVGNALINDKDFTFDQGRSISTATGLGMLPGIAVLYSARSSDIAKAAPILSIIGAAIGFTVAYNNNVEEARQNHNKRTAAGGIGYSEPDEQNWWKTFVRNSDFQVSPLGLVGLINPGFGGPGLSLPLLNYRYTFGKQEKTTIVPVEENYKYSINQEKNPPDNE